MAFENNFAISFSQVRKFRGCQRRWWIDRVLAWNGWRVDAPLPRRLAYRLNQLQTSWTLVGAIVHRLCARAVRGDLALRDALRAFEKEVSGSWTQAVEEAQHDVRLKPKGVANLAELYYRGSDWDPEETFTRAVSRGFRCVENLYSSTPYIEARQGVVIEAEELNQVKIDGIPTWVSLDLLYRIDDKLKVWDFKTGNPSAGEKVQVLLYGEYAAQRYKTGRTQIRLGLCHLQSGSDQQFTAAEPEYAQLRSSLRKAGSEIQAKLDNPKIVEAPMDRFPKTKDLEVCKGCPQFFVCKGHKDRSRPDMETSSAL